MAGMQRIPADGSQILRSNFGRSLLPEATVYEPPTMYNQPRSKRVKGQAYKRPTMKYDNVPRLQDIREHRQVNGGDLYDSLINVILNHKKEIKKVPRAMTLEGANRYAKSLGNGHRAAMVDLNPEDGLGEEEVVVYNKAGMPVIINGYKLANSDFAYRNAYLTQYPKGMDSQSKTKKSYQQWLDEQWGYHAPENPWEEATIDNERVEMFDNFYSQGYAQKNPRKRTLTPNQIFAKLWSQALKEFYDGIDGFVEDETLKLKLKVAKRLIRPIHLQQLAFLVLFDVIQYNVQRGDDRTLGFNEWRAILKSNPVIKENYRNQFIEHICSDAAPYGMLGDSGLQRVASFLGGYQYTVQDQARYWLDDVIPEQYMGTLQQEGLIGGDGYIIPSSQMNPGQKYAFNAISESVDSRMADLKDGIKSAYINGGMMCVGVNDFPQG